jgi:hypothetical protein
MFVLAGGLVGQEPKKDDPKKDDSAVKLKGRLPLHWAKIGLSDEQKQTAYKIKGKYEEEIEKLKAKQHDLEVTMEKELRAILTADQKKRLEEEVLKKSTDKEEKKDKDKNP